MAAININEFKTATVDEWGEAFGLICLVPGTTAYQHIDDEYYYTIGFSSDEDLWVCEIDEHDGGCAACWQGDTPQHALENALVEVYQSEAFDEGNCEDAVNHMAYRALEHLYGAPYSQLLFELGPEVTETLDRLMGQATHITKARGPIRGIEWEPYQVCES